jgi:hypothetical protein
MREKHNFQIKKFVEYQFLKPPATPVFTSQSAGKKSV